MAKSSGKRGLTNKPQAKGRAASKQKKDATRPRKVVARDMNLATDGVAIVEKA